MRQPRIGITTSLTVQKTPERSYLNSSYIRAIQQAGGAPVPLPPPLSHDALDEVYPLLDGILLTGGGDIDPERFGEAPHLTLFDVVPDRDQLEMSLVTRSLSDGKPLLAICRGIQVLNVALGGGLYQDIASEPGSSVRHSQSEARDQPTHKVKVTPQSFLAEVLGKDELEVNSLHHQAVKALGKGLTAVAHAPDQIIEGIELADSGPRRFVLGVQWHPEELVARDESARRLFSALVAASRT
jgi:putative glutamine amidotransferase